MITGVKRVLIEGFENYEINQRGVVFNLNRYVPEYDHTETIKPRIDRGGYWSLRLHKDGKSHTFLLHRLLAESFLSNPENLPLVNHKNGIKTDNTLSNLEWCSHATNIYHAHQLGLIKRPTKKVVNTSTGVVFQSAKEAAIFCNIPYSTFKNYLSGRRKNPTCFKYLDTE